MTKKEIEDYRCNQFPDEILELMAYTGRLARLADNKPFEHESHKEFLAHIRLLLERAEFYYQKRKSQFGFEHLLLKKLMISCKELLAEV